MRKKLILNADDYGWDADASNAIIELIESDKLKNVTVLANHCNEVAFKKIGHYNSHISIGLHVCLNEGLPVSKNVFSLHHPTGNFYSSKELFIKAISNKIKYEDVLREIKAQYYLLKDSGIDVSHADSHQHIHQYPILSAMIVQALKEIGITRIRNCKPISIYDRRRIIITAFCLFTQSNINAFNHPDILVTDFTNTKINVGKSVPDILKKIASSNYETIEWMCHPGIKNRTGSYLQREEEYTFLKNADWDILLKKLPIELSQYKFL
jgi:predicted glycoside hydrolase/deacetylase ChbG (UPF0249 family)